MTTVKFIICCLFILCALQISSRPSFAQPSTSPTPYNQIHPGLLPDHPFYFVKVVRDTFIGYFKGKPLDRAEFSLEQSEKQFAATHALIMKDKPELAQVTLQNGQKYFEEAIIQTKAAQGEGVNIEEMKTKLQRTGYHQERTIIELKESLTAHNVQRYQEAKIYSQELVLMSASLSQ